MQYLFMLLAAHFLEVIASPTHWLVFPQDSLSREQENAVASRLGHITGDPATVREIFSETWRRVEFWKVRVGADKIDDIRQLPQVRLVAEDKPLTQAIDDAWPKNISTTDGSMNDLQRQHHAPEDLILISWPRQKELPKPDITLPYPYEYYNDFENLVTIYVVDEAVNKYHDEFADLRAKGRIRYIFADGTDKSEADKTENGHGTCVASKAVGKTLGVARNSELVVVKIPLSNSGLLDGFSKIADDILDKPKPVRALVISSVLSQEKVDRRYPSRQSVWYRLTNYIATLEAAGMIVFVAAGNDAVGKDTDVTHVPPILGYNRAINVAVVSGSTLRGNRDSHSQFLSTIPLWAPIQVICAHGKSNTDLDIQSGTSLATPLVAGTFAYLWSLPGSEKIIFQKARSSSHRAFEARQFLAFKSSTWFRGKYAGDKRIIYNRPFDLPIQSDNSSLKNLSEGALSSIFDMSQQRNFSSS